MPFCSQIQKKLSNEKNVWKTRVFSARKLQKIASFFFREKKSRKTSTFYGNLKSTEIFGREHFKIELIKNE